MEQSFSSSAPHTIAPSAMTQEWRQLTFLHWSYPADVVQALLPKGLTVQRFDDTAWVGLVPFNLVVRLPKVPTIPWLGRFPETNVRTYVTDAKTGRQGVWFFSLEADRLAAVIAARVTYRLPYFWNTMNVRRVGETMLYESRRKWPSSSTKHCKATIRVGSQYKPDELSDFDHYLTARFTLFSKHARGLHYADAYHDVWALHRAQVVELDENLVSSTGLAAPSGSPTAHYSPGVSVDLGFPRRL